MKLTKLDKTVETKIDVKDVLSLIEGNRTRVRNLCNIILTSCSLCLSSSFVIMFFLVKEAYQSKSLIALLLFSDILLIVAILFAVLSTYIREPKVITTEFALICSGYSMVSKYGSEGVGESGGRLPSMTDSMSRMSSSAVLLPRFSIFINLFLAVEPYEVDCFRILVILSDNFLHFD